MCRCPYVADSFGAVPRPTLQTVSRGAKSKGVHFGESHTPWAEEAKGLYRRCTAIRISASPRVTFPTHSYVLESTKGNQNVQKPAQAKYIAPAIHAFLFLAMWLLYWACAQPLMDGPSALPFFILFIADLPKSIFAFGVMFTSSINGTLAAVGWGILGTFWWFLIGLSIDARARKKHGKTTEEIPSANGSEQSSETLPPTDAGVRSHGREWLIAGSVVLGLVLIALVWKWNGAQGAVQNGGIRGITFAPDDRSVLLSRSQGDSSLLYRVALDSGNSERLDKADSGRQSSPSFSPDGKQIAFVYVAQENEHSRVFIMGADGSNVHPLFSSRVDGDDLSPRFSLDGKEIYFARSRPAVSDMSTTQRVSRQWDVYSVDLDGQNVQPLTDRHFYNSSGPSFSGDGKKIVFSTESQSGRELHIFPLGKTTEPETVLQPHVPNEPRSPIYSNPSLDADGSTLYFLAASQGAKAFDYDVYRLDLAGGTVDRITTANGFASDLCVSADSRYAAFLRWTSKWGSTPNVSKMYLLDLTTKRMTALNITGTR